MESAEKFTILCSALMNGGHAREARFCFLCESVGADETQMNNMFYENFGMSGEDVFYKFLRDSIVIAV